jgi:hypothetical protein
MKYAVEIGSGAMIYIPSLIKIGSVIQKLMGIHRHHGDLVSLLNFLAYFPYFKKIRKLSL